MHGVFTNLLPRLSRTRAPHRALQQAGDTVVHGFLKPAEAAELRSIVLAIYAAMGAAPDLVNDDLADNFRRWHGVWVKGLPDFLDAHHPDLAARYRAIEGRIVARAGGLLGAGWQLLPERSFFRRHIGMTKKVPWHIDADAAVVASLADQCVNVWLPLDRVGEDLPSLEIAHGSRDHMRGRPLLSPAEAYRDDAFVAAYGWPTSAPRLDVGDALVFDQYTLHRTQNVPGADIMRTACEFRFTRRKD